MSDIKHKFTEKPKIKRETDEMGDTIINGRLSIQELYDFAVENELQNAELYFIGKEEGERYSDIHAAKVTTFGRGWGKQTVMIHFEYERDLTENDCGPGN